VGQVLDEELARLRVDLGDEAFEESRADEAKELFEEVALGEELAEFLTVPAYERLE
jgi:malate synthase